MQPIAPKVALSVHRKSSPPWDIPTRTIDNHELVLILGGRGMCTIEGKTFALSGGELLYFYPGLKHSMHIDRPPYLELIGIHFDFEGAPHPLPIPEHSALASKDRLLPVFSALHKVWIKKGFLYRWEQDILLQQILFELIAKRPWDVDRGKLERVSRATQHIHANPYKRFSLDELAQKAQLKKSYFSQLFRQVHGTSPLQYATSLKLEHAKSLLVSTDLPIAAIAHACGFADEYYFSRLFKKHNDLSPSAFRRQEGGIPL